MKKEKKNEITGTIYEFFSCNSLERKNISQPKTVGRLIFEGEPFTVVGQNSIIGEPNSQLDFALWVIKDPSKIWFIGVKF